jgi:hypothetical protein
MAKDAYWFKHDFGARNDPKLQIVLRKLGHEGKSVFWDLVEMLHEEGGYLQLKNIDDYAFSLRTKSDVIHSLIYDFELFHFDDKKFWSVSALLRITDKDEKTVKTRDAAAKSWQSRRNADALQVQSESNAIRRDKKRVDKIREIYKGWGFFDKSFLIIWNDYLEMRVKIRKPATERAEELALQKLNDLSGGNREVAGKIVEQSTANSWQGLFPLKADFIFRSANSDHPDYYSKKYEDNLQQKDRQMYWKHLRDLGFEPKKDNQQTVIDWVKRAS